MLWRDTALQISTPDRFIPRFLLLLPASARQLLVSACVALGLVAATAQADSDPFQDVVTLARQGVPELALQIIDEQQTSIDPLADAVQATARTAEGRAMQEQLPGCTGAVSAGCPGAAEWAAWEKARILIYQQRRDWASVVRRAQTLPDNLPLTFTRWVLTQGVAAQLESGQGAAARAWLLSLIWQPADVDSQLFGQWRRMVIHSYIVDGRRDDAYAAMLRYQQDYADASTDVQTQLLQAHVLLLSGRAAEAATLLVGTQEPTTAALHLLARLRSGGHPENILQEARQLLAPQQITPSQGLAAVVQAEAARVIGDHERHVEAVEYILALYGGVTPPVFAGLFNITDDSVWDAYGAYAQVLGNQQQLLMGDFAPWFAMAQSLVEEHPIRARALFAFLAMRADDAQGGASVAGGRMPGATTVEIRVSAHQQLITLLGQLPQGAALMRALYVKLERFR